MQNLCDCIVNNRCVEKVAESLSSSCILAASMGVCKLESILSAIIGSTLWIIKTTDSSIKI